MSNEESHIQRFTVEYLDADKTEIELSISTNVDSGVVNHLEIGVLAQAQCEGYPRIEEYEKAVLQSMQIAIIDEIARIEHIGGRKA